MNESVDAPAEMVLWFVGKVKVYHQGHMSSHHIQTS